MNDEPGSAVGDLRTLTDRLATDNALLAEWTACSAEHSPPLIDRLEQLGYDVRGKSHADVVKALSLPPTRASRIA